MPSTTSNLATVRTFSKSTDELQISFFYRDIKREFKRKKEDTLAQTLDRMKRKLIPKTNAKKNKKKEETKKVEADDTFVCWLLDENAEEVNGNTTNIDSFVEGRLLQIDSTLYSLCVDPPLVTQMSLPNQIMTGFPIIPCVGFENASAETSLFSWYVSYTKTATTTTIASTAPGTATLAAEAATSTTTAIPTSAASATDPEEDWTWVEEGFVFVPTDDVIGRRVKCLCNPGNSKVVTGPFEECVSQCVVTPGPRHNCLFDTCHTYTPSYHDTCSDRLRVVSYNILANVFADTEYARSQLFPFCPPHALKSDYRRPLLMKEILGYHGDLVCLQECSFQEYERYLKNWMIMHEYAGFLNLKIGGVNEGEAFFYRTTRFQHIADLSIPIKDTFSQPQNQQLVTYMRQYSPHLVTELIEKSHIAQIHVLRERQGGCRLLCVVNTHLYYERHSPYVRLLQMAALINHLQGVLDPYMEEEDISMLLTGDFNAVPAEPLHKYLRGEITTENDDDWSQIRKKPDTDDNRIHLNNITRTLFTKHHNDVKCPITLQRFSSDVKYTMYAPGFGVRPGATMDYIYGDNSFEKMGVVPVPIKKDIDVYEGVPCVGYPSDHFALVVDLKWSL